MNIEEFIKEKKELCRSTKYSVTEEEARNMIHALPTALKVIERYREALEFLIHVIEYQNLDKEYMGIKVRVKNAKDALNLNIEGL